MHSSVEHAARGAARGLSPPFMHDQPLGINSANHSVAAVRDSLPERA